MNIRLSKAMTPQSDDNGIAQSQTLSGGGVQNFTLNGALVSGGVFTAIDSAHIIEIVSAGDDHLLTFTVYGTDSRDISISEAITGIAIGTASTTKHFKTVTRITSSGNTAGAVIIGVSGKCVSPWVLFTGNSSINIGLGVVISSGANLTYRIEHTFDNVNSNTYLSITTFPHGDIVDKNANDDGNYAFSAYAYRCKVTAFTSGTLTFHTEQIV